MRINAGSHLLTGLAILMWAALLKTASAQQSSTAAEEADDGSAKNSPVNTSQQAQHPYVGLPIGHWSILQLNAEQRSAVCQEQQSFCTSQCGGTAKVQMSFCNETTMAWGCTCQNMIPDCPPYQWPVTVAECNGKEKACADQCSPGPIHELCLSACHEYYKCNRAGGPQSFLQTNNPSDIPIYDQEERGASLSNSQSQLRQGALLLGSSMLFVYWIMGLVFHG